MECIKCRTELPDNAKFCFNCGCTISAKKEEKKPVKALFKKDEEAETPEVTGEVYYEDDISPQDEVYNPQTDKYWDDVLPVVSEEINRLPKDLILKGAVSVVAFVVIVYYLIYMLN